MLAPNNPAPSPSNGNVADRLVGGQQLDRGGEPDGPEDDVDQEHRPPRKPAEVGVDDEASENGAQDRGATHDRAERAERSR
ncbi:MAG: hypothetical protein ACR2LE_01315 [Nocardioidaceae bacterium]